jgi:hypothetical protein
VAADARIAATTPGMALMPAGNSNCRQVSNQRHRTEKSPAKSHFWNGPHETPPRYEIQRVVHTESFRAAREKNDENAISVQLATLHWAIRTRHPRLHFQRVSPGLGTR